MCDVNPFTEVGPSKKSLIQTACTRLFYHYNCHLHHILTPSTDSLVYFNAVTLTSLSLSPEHSLDILWNIARYWKGIFNFQFSILLKGLMHYAYTMGLIRCKVGKKVSYYGQTSVNKILRLEGLIPPKFFSFVFKGIHGYGGFQYRFMHFIFIILIFFFPTF